MSGELYDAPNQQVVGLDPPWVEGDGGGEPAATKTKTSRKAAKADDAEEGAEDD